MKDDEQSESWLERLGRLNAVISATGEPLAGNLFYDHHQEDYLGQPPLTILQAKRDRVRQAIAGRSRLLEIGVNGGHSAYLALTANPDLEFHGVDICEHAYVWPAVKWLENEFPGRVYFDEGGCLEALPAIARRGLAFDAFHIDGAKYTYYADILNCQRIASGGAIVIMDDTQEPGVSRTWRRCTRHGLIDRLEQFPPMAETSKYRNEIGVLQPFLVWKWPVLFAYGRLLGARGAGGDAMRTDFPSEWVDYFDCIYDKWESEWQRFGDHPALAGQRVLDFGCGFGAFAARAAQEGASVVGADIDQANVTFAGQHCRDRFGELDIEFSTKPLEKLGTFDIIMTHEVFEHILNLEECLETLHERLRPRGLLYAAWGPLWSSPLGGHQLVMHIRGLPVPYSHLATRLALARFRARTGEGARSIQELHLNGLRPRDYEVLTRRSPFDVVSWQTNVGKHPAYRLLQRAATIVPRFAISNTYAILRKGDRLTG